jgi:adenosine deaminase
MQSRTPEFYRSLPKVDLHRHLEGSLRLGTLLEVAKAFGIDLPGTDRLRPMVQINRSDPLTSQNFLSKFETLREFYRSPEVIVRLTKEAIADAAADNIRYLELRFTPVALSRVEDFPMNEVLDWVIQGANEASSKYEISTRLIASVNRHESLELAAKVIELAIDRREDGIVGIDLAGNEAEFPTTPFAPLFQEAKQSGMRITVHAGEWGGPENIDQAINLLGAERVGHGVRIIEDETLVTQARERGITFEVCITSNYQSGVVADLHEHPLNNMIAAGLNVTINTDDPSISQISLSDEYQAACEQLGLSIGTLRQRVLAGVKAAFLPVDERNTLVAALEENFPAPD